MFVGYGNGGNPDSSGGAISNIIEYDMQGNLVNNIAVPGHNDGLKINPQTGDLWALQNETRCPAFATQWPGILSVTKATFKGIGNRI